MIKPYRPSFHTCVGTAKRKRRSSEEVAAQNKKNNDLAAEYKTATPWRRKEILQEYYDGNRWWVGSWPRWSREHWEELTQIFVSYWHEAFMRYSPQSESSVFNFFMDRIYKSTASQDYKRFLKKTQEGLGLEYEPGVKGEELKPRKEIFLDTRSDLDRARLRVKLCRNLDTAELDLVDAHFFSGESLYELVKKESLAAGKELSIKQISQAAYNFKRRVYDRLLDKLYLNVTKQELMDNASKPVQRHPLEYLTLSDRNAIGRAKGRRNGTKKVETGEEA